MEHIIVALTVENVLLITLTQQDANIKNKKKIFDDTYVMPSVGTIAEEEPCCSERSPVLWSFWFRSYVENRI
jgi:hypothetical protein